MPVLRNAYFAMQKRKACKGSYRSRKTQSEYRIFKKFPLTEIILFFVEK